MNALDFLFAPTILFLTIVAPLWIFMHYRSISKSREGLKEEDRESIEEMLVTIDKLVDRIDVLERILDQDLPQWRKTKQQN